MRKQLLEEIRGLEVVDSAERKHQGEILALMAEPDFASRNHFLPGHITASAFVVDPAAERLLLHHHRRLGRWLQMGGHMEAGESPRDAALREASEESGLRDLRLLVDRIIDVDVHDIPASPREPAHRHFDLRFLAATRSPSEIVIDPAESLALRWFGLDEAIVLMNEPCSGRAVEKIRRILAQWSDSPND